MLQRERTMTHVKTLTIQLSDRLLAELEKDPETVWPSTVAAAFLSVSNETLRKWRRTGEGPQFVHLSRIKIGYQKHALLTWVKARLRQSTAEAAAGSGGGAS